MAQKTQDRRAMAELRTVEKDALEWLRLAVEDGSVDDAIEFALLVARARLMRDQIREGLLFLIENYRTETSNLADEDLPLDTEIIS